jgi:hypothetical protein
LIYICEENTAPKPEQISVRATSFSQPALLDVATTEIAKIRR